MYVGFLSGVINDDDIQNLRKQKPALQLRRNGTGG